MTDTAAPRVLVLGATGGTGGAIAAALDASEGVITVRATRNQHTANQWRDDGKNAVYVDLDDPRTFAPALDGIDRVFLMAGYTSAMTHQGKTLVDAAEDAGVNFIVHLGVFGDGRSTDPHFAWHELIERYIKGSTLEWANLHPHVFMENLLTVNRLQGNAFVWAAGHKPVGWVAAEDIAAVAATVLAEGPRIHAGKDYYLSTDLLNAEEVAETLSGALGQHIPAVVLTPQDLQNLIAAGQVDVPSIYDDAYAASALDWLEQTFDGRMDYAALTTTTVTDLLHRPPIHLTQWATSHRQDLLAQLE
ncbi:NmrA family NAD(P)-binding protein [Mycolicibacterium mucogenicum]|uniref:NmrA family NAD(P)-binding protein n=1 Tax=Mycolicibacterium mucogenicum TaxID=56689 RepID=UPI00226AA6F5|nr:NmrA family NAD(P)-binding protein [Mycolicibacterium mucogenicum]MCX8563014.1 NmrA family NAD(P)-binding protein [Mycolicibacterium mucogenicum]